jgi:hypothetical protein
VAIQDIARLAGHSSSRTTEMIKRTQLSPVSQTGATVKDGISSAQRPVKPIG